VGKPRFIEPRTRYPQVFCRKLLNAPLELLTKKQIIKPSAQIVPNSNLTHHSTSNSLPTQASERNRYNTSSQHYYSTLPSAYFLSFTGYTYRGINPPKLHILPGIDERRAIAPSVIIDADAAGGVGALDAGLGRDPLVVRRLVVGVPGDTVALVRVHVVLGAVHDASTCRGAVVHADAPGAGGEGATG
jgi:hypothetical protein